MQYDTELALLVQVLGVIVPACPFNTREELYKLLLAASTPYASACFRTKVDSSDVSTALWDSGTFPDSCYRVVAKLCDWTRIASTKILLPPDSALRGTYGIQESDDGYDLHYDHDFLNTQQLPNPAAQALAAEAMGGTDCLGTFAVTRGPWPLKPIAIREVCDVIWDAYVRLEPATYDATSKTTTYKTRDFVSRAVLSRSFDPRLRLQRSVEAREQMILAMADDAAEQQLQPEPEPTADRSNVVSHLSATAVQFEPRASGIQEMSAQQRGFRASSGTNGDISVPTCQMKIFSDGSSLWPLSQMRGWR
eukprot:COSAG01_NODE_5119_length_4472_cov_20.726961_2_plen_307_part_00